MNPESPLRKISSDQVNELYTALSKAQAEMDHATKDSTNPHFKSKYADLASVLDACASALSKHGLIKTQTLFYEDERQYLVTRIGHTSGQWIQSVAYLPQCARPQEFGSLLTYLRRYSLSAICGIAQEDDDANEANKGVDMKAPKGNKLSNEQINEIDKIIAEIGDENLEQFICKRAAVKELYDVEANKYEGIMKYLRTILKNQKEEKSNDSAIA